MKTLALFILLLFTALLLSALVNYPLYQLMDGHQPPQNMINTTAKFMAIPLVWWAAWALGLRSWADLGYNLPKRSFWITLAKGWLVGVLVMLGLMVTMLALEIRVFRALNQDFVDTLLRAAALGLVGGLLVALVEETFIRGAMFSAMRREASLGFSLVVSSLYFALLHFIDPQPLDQPPDWLSGLEILGGSFHSFLHPLGMLDSLLALTAAGVLLALIRERQGNLAFAIGMHAGWVFIIKISTGTTWVNDQSNWLWGIGNYDRVNGWISLTWLVLLITGYALWIARHPKSLASAKM